MSKVKKTAQVFHFDLYGKREFKYDFLNENSLNTLKWNELNPEAPNFFLVKKDFDESGMYEQGFKIGDLFEVNITGIKTHSDDTLVSFEKFSELNFKYDYRPFDCRNIHYDLKKVVRARYSVMKNMLQKNICLIIPRQAVTDNWNHVQVSKNLSDNRIHYSNKGIPIVCPLYLYPETTAQQTLGQTADRTPNLNPEIVNKIAEKLGLKFVNEKTSPTPPMEGLSKSGYNEMNSTTFSKNKLSSSPSGRLGGVEISPTPPMEGLSRPGYITANPLNYLLIKEMRDNLKNNPTEAEKVIWEFLRNKKTGHKIRRQHIIDDFITDFVCLSKKVVIEIDGKIHLQQKEYDELRTARLNELEYEVIRFRNEEVFANPQAVTLKIKEKLDNKINIQSDNDATSPPSEGPGEVFAPIDILDYIYAVLHSPTYREKYKEFLKIDFPRVPYPTDYRKFTDLVDLGRQLREIHLLESPVVNQYITQYPIHGDNVVGKIHFENNRVYINYDKTSPLGIEGLQYFDNVPKIAWEFYIGGYQPAQKWLKDRKTRTLEFDDILHYQKIIVALTETHRLMQEIDKIGIE